MSKVDLTSLEWCELIFKDRNKNYGAYKMRRDLGRRQTASLVIVTVVAFAGFTLPRLVKMAMPEQKEEMVEVTQLSALEEPEVKEETLKKVEPIAPPPPALKSTIKFTAPVIKKDEEVHDDDELKSQDELTETKVQISIADVKGNDELNGKDIADLQEVITQAPEAQEEEPYMMVEQMPQFPGGPAELLKYIAKNLKYPVIAQENGIQGKVILRFVVNAQGHVENVKVLRSLDPYCDKEAIRVVKSLPQWIPGNRTAVTYRFIIPALLFLNYSNHQVYEKEINAISVVHAHVLGL